MTPEEITKLAEEFYTKIITEAMSYERADWDLKLSRAVNERCSCGGAGPGEGCEWCELYHEVRGTTEK